MSRLLFVVRELFVIEGRGLVPLPGVLPLEGEWFRIGDPLLLRRPGGSTIQTVVAGIEMLTPNPSHEVVFMLKELSREDVPIGTEVWAVDRSNT